MPSTESYKFFNHSTCEFYPCHDMSAADLNCLFCFCPLYEREHCPGNPEYINSKAYIDGANGERIKDCSACTLPHRRENYDYIMGRLAE